MIWNLTTNLELVRVGLLIVVVIVLFIGRDTEFITSSSWTPFTIGTFFKFNI